MRKLALTPLALLIALIPFANATSDMGIWYVPEYTNSFPSPSKWVAVANPNQDVGFEINATQNVILDYLPLHTPWGNPFVTASDLADVETGLLALNMSKYWGVIFIAEEHTKTEIDFEDSLNVTWLGENLLGYPLWNAVNGSGSASMWLDEMYLRMIRGFHNNFTAYTNIGQTLPCPSIQEAYYVDYRDYYYGDAAYEYMKANYDFFIFYAYTTTLSTHGDPHSFIRPTADADVNEYFDIIAADFPAKTKFWIGTRIWDLGAGNPASNTDYWQIEAVALEVKNAIDQNMVLLYQWDSTPTLGVMWPVLLDAINHYNASDPYYESYVSGTNLLTDETGITYGFVSDATPTATPTPMDHFFLPDSTSGLDGLIGVAAVFGVFILIIWPFVGSKVKERF